jgi:hypothetical protein
LSKPKLTKSCRAGKEEEEMEEIIEQAKTHKEL